MKKVLLFTLVWLIALTQLSAQDPTPGYQTAEAISKPGSEKVKVYVKHSPGTYQPKRQVDPTPVEFAVQLSATSRPVTDKTMMKQWEDIGPVYIHRENNLYKIRIGPYNTQEGAKAVLLKAKERGRNDAFIVVQKGHENHEPYEFPQKSISTADIADNGSHIEEEEIVPNDDLPAAEYKVQLVSYLHPGGFNPSDVEKYGTLESYRKGEWTIMLIGGFKTKADAEKVRDTVIGKGYKDAKVVMDQDGILVETK